jgi:hypothetical protein
MSRRYWKKSSRGQFYDIIPQCFCSTELNYENKIQNNRRLGHESKQALQDIKQSLRYCSENSYLIP